MCFSALDIADCGLSRPFLATTGVRRMVATMRVVVTLVRISCLHTAFRGGTGLWQHAL
jgi:hypothetical protein